MLTKKQILKLSKLKQQTGFYEPDFDERKGNTLKGEHIIKLNLIYVEMPNGDVVIQKG